MEKTIFLLILAIATQCSAKANLRGVFIFGDSTADVGTNNFLPSSFKANFPPNGIDFPHSKTTGRFSNGFNSADFLSQKIGLARSPPPFLAFANRTDSLKRQAHVGFNFASAGSGILGITGQTDASNQKNVVSLGEQIEQFSSVHSRILASKGHQHTKQFLCKSLFFISIGSNDILSFLADRTIPKELFLPALELAYENHLRNLLKLGARKFGIISIPPIGCCPSQRILNVTGGCLEPANDLARALNSRIKCLMDKLSKECSDIKFSIGDTFEITINVIRNPRASGLEEVEKACCGAGKFNAELGCSPKANLCFKRDEYLFWDLFHPTQAASYLAATTLFNGGPQFVTPINFKQLVEMKPKLFLFFICCYSMCFRISYDPHLFLAQYLTMSRVGLIK